MYNAGGALQRTYTYTYDTVGNLLTASDGSTAHTYAYGDEQWRDLLTAYDGHAITYDQTGNPLTYYDGSAFTWKNGRQLAEGALLEHSISKIEAESDSSARNGTKQERFQRNVPKAECYGGTGPSAVTFSAIGNEEPFPSAVTF